MIDDTFKATGYTASDLDWFVPHQANQRIIDGICKKLGMPAERVVVHDTGQLHGTSTDGLGVITPLRKRGSMAACSREEPSP